MYEITEVDGEKRGEEIQRFNKLFKDDFLPLKPKHLKGMWWLVHDTYSAELVAFAGVVPFEPFERHGYFKRVAVLPEHRGNGLQKQLMGTIEIAVRDKTDWTHIVSDTHVDNIASANNFIRSGYLLYEAERWEKDFLIWKKAIERD